MFISTSADLRPLTTAHLAQTMHLLEMNTTELEEAVSTELANNPALELVNEPRCPNCGRRLKPGRACAACAVPEFADGPIVYLTPRLASRFGGAVGEADDEPRDISAQEKLSEHLLRQIAPELAADERRLAAYLIASLDEDGFLTEPLIETARHLRAPVATLNRILALIQTADPAGIGARNAQESLLIQIEALGEVTQVPEIAGRIIRECWEALGRLDHVRIARSLGVPRRNVEAAVTFISRNLTPYPARAFWGSGRGPAGGGHERFYNPDVTISRSPNDPDGPLVVEVFTPFAGWLRVDPTIKSAVANVPEADREKWEKFVERASLFAKCVPQRNHTMRRLMQAIVGEQREFIINGDRYLEPMTRASLAARLGVHESTISRAVAHKTAALPDGRIIPLAKFFDRSLSVRDAVKDIIAREVKPLTDDEIVVRLAEQNIHIARRTVAKYRAAEGILPAPLRSRALVTRSLAHP